MARISGLLVVWITWTGLPPWCALVLEGARSETLGFPRLIRCLNTQFSHSLINSQTSDSWGKHGMVGDSIVEVLMQKGEGENRWLAPRAH